MTKKLSPASEQEGLPVEQTESVDEVALLRSQVEELKAMLLSLQQTKETENVEGQLRSDDTVQVMSLIPWELSLSTLGNGKGRKYKYTRFGETKEIIYSDVRDIVENNRRFLENGHFYILNKKALRSLGLTELYTTILTKEKLEAIFDCRSNAALEIYKSANESQRKVANQVIITKLKKGEYLDMNIVSEISEIAKLDLRKLAKESKELEETNKETQK